ncbi:UNVERIFIED_CONTAM: Outer envelope protein 80, chloroplastic [Sesamum radiatum]|uniref:Outer envelope protein 80, chloroplastic n=1 Tax=Sesamum radiatum TaxID=300843 RepID=A0AAW2QDQ9_SESRA
MPRNDDVRFISSSIKLPSFSPPPALHLPQNDDVRFIFSSIKLPSFSPPALYHPQPRSFSSLQLNPGSKFARLPFNFNFQFNFGFNPQPINFITQFVRNQPIFCRNIKNGPFHTVLKKSPLFCSATLALPDSETGPASNELKSGDDSESVVQYKGVESGAVTQSKSVGSNHAAKQKRVFISKVFVRNKDGEELEKEDLESEALNALKALRVNSAFTGAGRYLQRKPNQEFQGLVCEGANVLPSKFIEDAFYDGYGKVINKGRLTEVMRSINGWYKERGLLGKVSGLEILSGGIIKLQVSEAVVNDISIRFFDETGKPTVGKTRPETVLRQLTTKKGQVYNRIQAERLDVDIVRAMGIFDYVRIIPQEAGDTGKVDLTINVIEPKIAVETSGGGGISNGSYSLCRELAGLIGRIAICHKNLFGRNKQLHMSLESREIDSKFRMKYTDPWIEGGDKRTSRTIMIENSRTPGNQPNNNGLTIRRITGGIEFSRPFRPNWNGTAGLIFQRVGAHDEKGIPIKRDLFGSPLTASGNTHDDMLLAKLETVYTSSGASTFAFNMDQGIPVSPEWPVFNRVNALARQGFVIGPARFLVSLSGGHVVGKLPHEAFPIGGRNSVRGNEAGAPGSGRSYVVGSGEMSFPVMRAVEGFVFADYGTDLGSGSTVPGDADGAGARNKPGSGYRYGIGVCVGPLRLEYGSGGFRYRIGL